MQLRLAFLLRAALTLAAATAFSAAWAANVLIVNGASSSGGLSADTTAATTNLQAQLVFAGHTVTVSDGVPADISGYDEVWDIAFIPALSATVQSQYLAHLKLGKRLIVLGENSSSNFTARNSSIIAFMGAAGVGSLNFTAPAGDDVPNGGGANDSIENVLPGFTSPNSIPNNQVIFAAPGGVTTPGSGVFLTRRPDGTSGAGIIYGKLVVIFDVNFLQNDPTLFNGTSQPFLDNLIAPAPTASKVVNGLGRPFSVAISSGSAFVADSAGHVVWKVDLTSGQKTIVAGTGEQGFNGDGIDALQAQLDTPSGVAVDSAGVLYIADTGNHVIRRVTTPGVPGALITTVAGVPTAYAVGESTDPLCATSTPPATCTPATGTRLFGPRAVAVDGAGNVYIADRMNQQIKKLYTSGPLAGYIFVIAGVAGFPGSNDGPITGTGAAHFNSPVGLAVDVNGTVYVADEGNNKIRVVNQANSDSSGSVNTLAAFGANLLRPTGVAVRGNGDILIADYGHHVIVDRSCSECVTTVAGTGTPGSGGIVGGPATAMQLNSPIGVAVDGDTLYISDLLNGRIVAVSLLPAIIIQ